MLKQYQILALACGMIVINAAWAEEPAKPAETQKPVEDDPNCLSYEPGVVMLKGKLHRLITNWTLELESPICINPRENAIKVYPRMDDVKMVTFQQLDNGKLEQYTGLIDKSVLATGTLHRKNIIGPDNGNVIIKMSDIEAVKDDASAVGK